MKPLGGRDRLLIAVLEMARVERFVARSFGAAGRPLACRASLARAFLANRAVDDHAFARSAAYGRALAAFVRLGAGRRTAERGHVQSRVCRVRGGVAARASACVADRGAPGGSAGRPYLARQQRHSCARAAGADRATREAREAPQAWSRAQGRAPAAQCRQVAEPAGTAADHVTHRHTRRSAMILSYRHQAKCPCSARAIGVITRSDAVTSCISTWPMAISRSAASRPARISTTAKSPCPWRR